MIPINRIKRWPFPGGLVNDSAKKPTGVRGPSKETPSLYGALIDAFGEQEGVRIFSFIQDLATEQATKTGGVPCICFTDEMGEFATLELDIEEEVVEDGVDEDEDEDDDSDVCPGPGVPQDE